MATTAAERIGAVPAGRRKRRREARMRAWTAFLRLIGAAVLAGAAALITLGWPRTARELTIEAGAPLPDAEAFVTGGFFHAEILSGLDPSVDTHTLGDRQVVLKILGMERGAVVHVVDTTPPAVETRDLWVVNPEAVSPEDLLVSVSDATETTVAFVEPPDLGYEGPRELGIAVTDEGGNRTVAPAVLDVVLDDTPPEIQGVKELTVTVGGTVSYKKDVTVVDDHDDAPSLEVDNSAVDLRMPGTYPVTYRATDFAGNTSEKTTRLYVITPMSEDLTEEMVYAAADSLLEELLTDDMDLYQKAKAIYRWCHGRIAYVDSSEKDNWIKAAWQGIVKRSGDCYVYCIASKVLLTRAGIENMVIERIPRGNSMHYWNLIDIGEGWHHFDTTPRAGNPPSFFYLTDSELMAYSNAHRGTHNYDRSKYPDIVP